MHDGSYENFFKPKVTSSFIEDEPKATEATSKKPSCCGGGSKLDDIKKRIHNATMKLNASRKAVGEKSVANCCRNKRGATQNKQADPNITSASYSEYPNGGRGQPRGNVMSCCMNKGRNNQEDLNLTSTSYVEPPSYYSSPNDESEIYHTTHEDTFNYSSFYSPSLPGGTFFVDERTEEEHVPHVPMPSRNYHTYDKILPELLSSPSPAGPRSHYGSTFNATMPNQLTQACRRDISSAARNRTSPFRNTRTVPRVNQLYTNPNLTRRSGTYNVTQGPYSSSFNDTSHTANEPSCCRDPNMSSFGGRPHSTTIGNRTAPPSSFNRSAIDAAYSRLADPNTNSFIQRPHSSPKGTRAPSPNSPPCCRGDVNRPQTAAAPEKRTCGRISAAICRGGENRGQRTSVGCQCNSSRDQRDQYGGEGNEEPLDTLLEIRTPHKSPGSGCGGRPPFVLSINVSCNERSVVITPENGRKALPSNPSCQCD